MDKHRLLLTGKIGAHLEYSNPEWAFKLDRFKEKYRGLDFVMTIHAIKDSKTYAQHAFYWGVVLPAMMDFTGLADKDDMDFVLRSKFLKRERVIDGETYVHIPSLQIDDIELDRASYSKYIEMCLNFLFESGGMIPEDKHTDEWRV